jgi:hypothetical protein
MTVRGAAPGVELAWWIVDEGGPGTPALNAALEPYAKRPVPVPWQTVDLWHANGLRLLAVPVGEADALRAKVHLVGPLQSQWLGQATKWTEIARGPRVDGPFTLALDNGPLTLRRGDLRLLLRCWVAPARSVEDAAAPAPRGALQVEIVPQFVPDAPPPTLSLPGGAPADGPRPLTLSRLTLETSLLGDEALLIVPEGEAMLDPAPIAGKKGPADAALPTLGETLLAPSNPSLNRRARVILVLVPVAPAGYRLLADQVR